MKEAYSPDSGATDLVDEQYRSRLEKHILGIIQRKALAFEDIICQSEGAYPVDVFHILTDLTRTGKLELHGNRYAVVGSGIVTSRTHRSMIARLPFPSEKQLSLKPLNVNSVFGDPHPADYDWRYTSHAREILTARLGPFIESRASIALLGAPTLYLSLKLVGVRTTLFDNSASVIGDLAEAGYTEDLVRHDMFHPFTQFVECYNVVVSDPPWYVPFYKAFILRSSELLLEQGLVFFSVPPWLTRPGALEDRRTIVKFATLAGFDLIESAPGILSYQSPKFERIALASQRMQCADWRKGDLFVFRKVKSARRSLRVATPADEPTWDEYRFGLLKVKLRHSGKNQVGELRIRPVSSEGSFLPTVSRRSPLRHMIDLWTSDNEAYSVTRLDIVKSALERLQAGEGIETIRRDLRVQAAADEVETLARILFSVTHPIEEEQFDRITVAKNATKANELRDENTRILLSEVIAPVLTDSFWRGRLHELLSDGFRSGSVHLAILLEPYLTFIIEGRKTVESRFSCNQSAPYNKIQPGDVILLKHSGGPIVGLCEAANVWFYELDPETWEGIKNRFAVDLCAQEDFWRKKGKASYATLIRVQNVLPIAPVSFKKRDRRGWVLLTENHAGEMRLNYG